MSSPRGTLPPALAVSGPPAGEWADRLAADPDLMREPDAMVRGLAYAGLVTLLVAPPKAGKSTLLTAAAAAYTTGQAFAGAPPGPPGGILWLAMDEPKKMLIPRLERWGADLRRVRVVSRLESTTQLADTLSCARAVEGETVRLTWVVVDTLGKLNRNLLGGDENNADDMDELVSMLTDLVHDTPVGLTCVHHAGANVLNSAKRYRGSTAIGATVDLITDMLVPQEGGPRRDFEFRGRLEVAPFALRLTAHTYELDRPAQALAMDALDQRVLDAVRVDPGHSKNWYAGSGGDRSEWYTVLNRLVSRGQLREERHGRGRNLFPLTSQIQCMDSVREQQTVYGNEGSKIVSALSAPKGAADSVQDTTPFPTGSPRPETDNGSRQYQASDHNRGEAWEADE